MKTKILFFLLSITCMFACKKQAIDYFSADIGIYYKNQAGQNLLDTSVANHIKESKIDVYYLIESKVIKQENQNLDAVENFEIETDGAATYLWLVLNPNIDSNNKSVTYLHLGNRVDTLTAEFYVTRNALIARKLQYNQEGYLLQDTGTSITVVLD